MKKYIILSEKINNKRPIELKSNSNEVFFMNSNNVTVNWETRYNLTNIQIIKDDSDTPIVDNQFNSSGVFNANGYSILTFHTGQNDEETTINIYNNDILLTGSTHFGTGHTFSYTIPNNINTLDIIIEGVNVTENTIWGTEIVEVTNPITGRVWMDRNIGATRAATSSTDSEAYGHLFQWGRNPDGHEIRTSSTTSTLSSTDVPGHGDFIISNSDWRSPQNDNLWQGIIADGWRLPTDAEWNEERLSWSSNNLAGAYGSVLKLPVAGYRGYGNGSLIVVGSHGFYWSSTVDGSDSRSLYFYSSLANTYYYSRAIGFSVRLIKDE